MILNRLVVVNFGVYRGRHEFDIRPQSTAPIILFGGKNGAGKTTILNAMRLCLYGPRALNEWAFRAASQADYERYLRERIHRNRNGVHPLDWASLELEFEYAIGGERQTYVVERGWKVSEKRVEETLNVSQHGKRLNDVKVDQWEDLIRGLVPPTIAQLFFFDAERVQSVINGSSEAHRIALSQAIRSLFGLGAIEQLQSDLTIYRRRQQKGNRVEEVDQEIETLDVQLEELNHEEEALLAQRDSLEGRIRAVNARIELQEAEIARVGGGFAQKRESYKEAQIRLQAQIEEAKQAIRHLCGGLLPFSIAPEYTTAVKEQLLHEAEYQQWLASKTFIEERLRDIQSEIESARFWEGTGAEALSDFQRTIGSRVVDTLQSIVEPPEELRHTSSRHHASEPVRRELLQWIEESQTTVPKEIERLTSRLSWLVEEKDEAESALQRVPADDVLGPLVEVLNEYHQELSALTRERLDTEGSLHRVALQREELKRILHKAWEAKETRKKLSEKVRRVVDVELALDEFRVELVRTRVAQLQELFVSNFNQICRKEQPVQRAEIDLDDFTISLVGADSNPLAQNALSAGEQQIHALALLWALRQVSGRPLPVIIDAPLGRLDSEHRQNLVKRYFPRASHQVILFSTDTEVDSRFYADLEDHVSRAYHLEFDQQRYASTVSEGYFWKSQRDKMR